MGQHDAAEAARIDFEAWRKSVWRNRFEEDRFFRALLQRHLGHRYAASESHLRQLAGETAAELDASILECSLDDRLPVLRRQDRDGRPTEEVVFHPAYHAVGRAFWSSGVLAVLSDPGSAVVSGAIAYLLDQHGEAGHACPVACTAGAIKLIQKLGTDEQRARYLPSLLQRDYERCLRAAQFVTEVQGGSDVGLNICSARPDAARDGWYRIRGEKWFCSVADAGVFVVSARHERSRGGTPGLGLFLVPRKIDGRPNGFALRRLKNKLGTRSMATGEIDFRDALGEAIGPLEDGFRNLVGIVLDTSRVHNALMACGLMRRAFVEAHGFARHRLAFGRRILDFPAVQETLARMRLWTMAALTSTFRLLDMSDRLERAPSDGLAAARRIAVTINKYWTSVASTRIVRDGIEILGGNGTIEDFSVLPRLYRDAIVIESWEGTHNTLCAQVLRDFAARDLHPHWLAQLEGEIQNEAPQELADHVSLARDLHRDLADRIDRLLAADATAAAAQIRHVVNRMCRLTDWTGLLAQARWDLEQDQDTRTLDALALYRLLELERTDPQDDAGLVALQTRLAAEP